MDCSQPPLGPRRNLNKHGGCELCASAGLWLADGCVINHGWGFAGVVPALANDIPPLPITFDKQSQLIPNHSHWDLSRISLILKNDEWDKSNDELRQEEMSQRKRSLLSWAPPDTADRNTGKCVHCASLPHSSSLFRAGCTLSNLVISLISVLMWQIHRSTKGVRR